MNLVERYAPFGSTSAVGAMPARQRPEPVLVGGMLAGRGTSTESAIPAEFVSRSPGTLQQTTSGTSIMLGEHAVAAIAELRRLSGLTWDQLARLFNVSRRSLHFWASGKAMAVTNEEHLQRVLAVLRKIDRGSASANRAALLAVREDGVMAFDLLVGGRYDAAVAALGLGRGFTRAATPPLSDDAKRARSPRPPEELASALHDRVHRETGAFRAAKSVRTRSGR